ncbi:zinc finger protein ZAT9-like [Phragmites australis]|uniref:zinc finger protein ZAT9-like n=1 Tax=Phragmites australis TaxID=29695 RepID=UPI002D78EEFD|nr:zinc finger protein ZAT9-like [Phragmites australis]
MDKHTCKLCFRRFHNGRALGGHMRSHAMAAGAAENSPPLSQQQSPPLSLASTSSTEMDDKPTQRKPLASCVLRESPKKSRKVGTPEFSGGGLACGESSVVQDGESDTESSPRGSALFAVSRRRSKRARRRVPPPAAPDPEPASSVSDATPEKDVAMSLVMLSRDSWTRSRSEPEPDPHWPPASSEAEQNNDDNVGLFDDADEQDRDVAGEAMAARPRSRHQCGVCKKVFRSYQALGGHRASIKKGKGGCVPVPAPPPSRAHRADAPVIHECTFCFRVFDSGQALGGHKRAHMPSAGAPAPSPSTPAKCGDSSGSIDLNVPAAMDDDFELSAVYEAEFGSTRH